MFIKVYFDSLSDFHFSRCKCIEIYGVSLDNLGVCLFRPILIPYHILISISLDG